LFFDALGDLDDLLAAQVRVRQPGVHHELIQDEQADVIVAARATPVALTRDVVVSTKIPRFYWRLQRSVTA
jgi:hypothetical protein